MNFRQGFKYVNKGEATRGEGLLERLLAIWRARKVKGVISRSRIDKKRILDIGCGVYPVFLLSCAFKERYAIEKIEPVRKDFLKRINFTRQDIGANSKLNYLDNFFDVVTMLAVFEHLDLKTIEALLLEVKRVLRPGGMFIFTTPSRFGNEFLKILAAMNIVSSEEVEEHQNSWRTKFICSILDKTQFSNTKASFFELFLNRCFVSVK